VDVLELLKKINKIVVINKCLFLHYLSLIMQDMLSRDLTNHL